MKQNMKSRDSQQQLLLKSCRDTRIASRKLASMDSEAKNNLLFLMADILRSNSEAILIANQKDLQNGTNSGLSDAMIDRLLLNEDRIEQMCHALHQVASQDDPIGEIAHSVLRPNGIRVAKMRIPLGVIMMIYEARPNVAVEAAALCLKAGNGIILRGGSDAIHSNLAIGGCWKQALTQAGFPQASVYIIENTDRSVMDFLLQFDEDIDLVIPRGGEGLIRYVVDNSRIPVIQHYKGVCHLYVDKDADLQMAVRLLIDGKVSRPGVCNALESLLVHKDIAAEFLPLAFKALEEEQVEMLGCEKSRKIINSLKLATESDFAKEFLDLIISVKIMDTFSDAISHIESYGSHHTEVVVTNNIFTADEFVKAIDASVVMVNASSRFSDGGELGLGAEIGISTSRLHAYGPMGINALTTEKFVVRGQGQIRK